MANNKQFCPKFRKKTNHKIISKKKDLTGWQCVKCGNRIVTKGRGNDE